MQPNSFKLLNLVIPVIALMVAGLTILNSIMPSLASYQLIFCMTGLLIMFFMTRIHSDFLDINPYFWYFLATVPLALTELFGVVSRGSTRWLVIFGFQFQTSEFAKVALILFSASWFAHRKNDSFTDILHYIFLYSIPVILVFFQPDLGSALLLASIGIFCLLVAGLSIKKLIPLFLGAMVILGIGWTVLKPYQQDRFASFLSPQNDPLGTGYNALQATIAVGSGQVFGRGLGQGTQSHLKFLPERHTDFIFASFVEELGLIGGIIVIGSYIWLIYGLLQLTKYAPSIFQSIICSLSASLILLQATINMGMNMGIFPITGVTLPLVSYGGSSMISTLLILGLNFSIAYHTVFNHPPIELR